MSLAKLRIAEGICPACPERLEVRKDKFGQHRGYCPCCRLSFEASRTGWSLDNEFALGYDDCEHVRE